MARITRSTSAKCAEQTTSICKAGPSQIPSPIKKTASIRNTNPLKPPTASVRVTRSMSKSASPPLSHPQPESTVLCDTARQPRIRNTPLSKAQYISIEVPKRTKSTPPNKQTNHKEAVASAKICSKSVHFVNEPAATMQTSNDKSRPSILDLCSNSVPTSYKSAAPLQAVTAYSSTRSRRSTQAASGLHVTNPISTTSSNITPSKPSARPATSILSGSTRPSPANRKRASPVAVSYALSDEEDEDDGYVVAVSGPSKAVLGGSAPGQPLGIISCVRHTASHTNTVNPVKTPPATKTSLTASSSPPAVLVTTSISRKGGCSNPKPQDIPTSIPPTAPQSLSPRKARKSRRRARSASADPSREAAADPIPTSTSKKDLLEHKDDCTDATPSSSSKQARPKKALPARASKASARKAPLSNESSDQYLPFRVTRSRSSSTVMPAKAIQPTANVCSSILTPPLQSRSSRKRNCSLVVDYNESDDDDLSSHDVAFACSDSDTGSDSDCSNTSSPRKRQRRKRRSNSKGPSSGKVELLCPLRIKKAISDIFKAPKFLRWNPHLSQKQLDDLNNPDGPQWPEDEPVFHPFVSPKKELGHGQKRIDGVKYSMHRLSFAAHNGGIDPKMDVSHVMDCGIGLSGRNVNALHLTQESNDDNQVRKGHHRIMQLHAQHTTDSCFGLHIETRCRKWDKSRVSQDALDQLDALVQEELRKMKPAKGK